MKEKDLAILICANLLGSFSHDAAYNFLTEIHRRQFTSPVAYMKGLQNLQNELKRNVPFIISEYFFTTQEAIQYLERMHQRKITQRSIQNAIHAKKIKGFKISGTNIWMVEKEGLVGWKTRTIKKKDST